MKNLPATIKRILEVPFVRHAATFQIGSMVMWITGMAALVLYPSLLGFEQYGLFAVVSSFTGIVCIIASFGQDTTLATFLSEAVGRGDTKAIRDVFRYFLQSSLLSLILYTALFLAAPELAGLFGYEENVGILARLLIATTALQFPAVPAILSLQIAGKIWVVTVLENIRTLLQFGIAITLLVMGYGVIGIFIGMLATAIAFIPVYVILYTRESKDLGFPSLSEMVGSLGGAGTFTYFVQGLWITVDHQIARNLYPNLFLVVLGNHASLAVVGLFRLALKLGSLPADLITPNISRLTAVSIPKIAAQNMKALKSACLKLMKGMLAVSGIAVIGAAIFVPPLLPYVYGPESVDVITPFLIILPFNLISAFNVACVPITRVFKKIWLLIVMNTIGIGLGLGGFYVLSPILGPLNAMSTGILLYHGNALILGIILWRFILRQHREITEQQALNASLTSLPRTELNE